MCGVLHEEFIEGDPAGTPLSTPPQSLFLMATLEIVVSVPGRNADYRYLLLTYRNYMTSRTIDVDETDEGCWVLPAYAYPVTLEGGRPHTVGDVRELFEDAERDVDLEKVLRRDMRQLAYQMGAAFPRISPVGSFIELRRSHRYPHEVKCFKILRFGLLPGDDGLNPRDLADPEVRRGHVFLPLPESEAGLDRWLTTIHSAPHERCQIWFLGKPLASDVAYILKDRSDLRKRAISLKREDFSRDEKGLLCTVDLAHWASHQTPELRQWIIEELETLLAQLGVTQRHWTGDGFIAAFPQRTFADVGATVDRLLRRWLDFLTALQESPYLQNPKEVMGSRMALHYADSQYGGYRYGRIGLTRSSSPAFDGDSIVKVTRLEQGLSLIPGERHRLVVSDQAHERSAAQLDRLAPRVGAPVRTRIAVQEFAETANVYPLRLDAPPDLGQEAPPDSANLPGRG